MAKISKPILIDDQMPSNSANADFFYNSSTKSLYYRDRYNREWVNAVTADPGPQGPQGPKGDPGTPIKLKATIATINDLPTSGNLYNDAYIVDSNNHIYVWQTTSWFDMGQVVGFDGPQGPPGPQGPQGETGLVNTSQNYTWSGNQQFNGQVTLSSQVIVTTSVNSFLNPQERSSIILTPEIGLLTFIEQDSSSNIVNRFEYWNGTSWSPIADPNAATLAGTETLTNKTMSGSSNTFSDIPQSAITGLAGTISGLSSTYSPLNYTINAQTESYTLVLSDAAKMVEMNVASANTLTIPLNSSVAFPTGTTILVTQTGAGQTTLTPTVGVTLNGTPGLKLRTRWSSAIIIKRSADEWLALGDLSA